MNYKERAALCQNGTAKKLFSLMEEKKSNLAASADFTRAEELLTFAERVAPEICVLKTHVDILEDFTPAVTEKLRALAERQKFILFEDRKFADIGHTVLHQYQGGIYKIAEWAEITNAHGVPGPGIIEGLKQVGLPKQRGLLLIAEMSSAGTLAQGEYTRKVVEMAQKHADFVIGFIAMGKICDDPRFIHMTPGIQSKEGKDPLGQQYQTPESALQAGSDLIIVGRGITAAKDPALEAAQFKKRAWNSYLWR